MSWSITRHFLSILLYILLERFDIILLFFYRCVWWSYDLFASMNKFENILRDADLGSYSLCVCGRFKKNGHFLVGTPLPSLGVMKCPLTIFWVLMTSHKLYLAELLYNSSPLLDEVRATCTIYKARNLSLNMWDSLVSST